MGHLRQLASVVLGPVARSVTTERVRILMYHRFGHAPEARKLSAAAFRDHLEYIKRHFTPIMLSSVVEAAREARPLPPRPVVVTVDDGYADFVDVAYPLLRHYGVPACVFVVASFAEGSEWAWYDKLRYVLYTSALREVRVDVGSEKHTLPLRTNLDREVAWQQVATRALRFTTVERERLVCNLAASAGVVLPSSVPPEFRASSADELRELDPSVVEIGGHTETHALLAHCSDEELEREVVASRVRLQGLLDLPIKMFCYPNGGPEDFDERSIRAVQRAGYVGATTAGGGPCTPDQLRRAPFVIPRLSIGEWPVESRNALNGLSYLKERLTAAMLRS